MTQTDIAREDQDGAEVLDETNLTEDGRDIANADDLPPVYDATTRREDSVDDDSPDPADRVEDERDPHTERQLDKGLKETFPASDPVSINPGAD